jgi:hypothetical protein
MFLQIVAFTADVGCNFESVNQTDTGDFAQRRVRFLGRRRVNTSAYSAPLRTSHKRPVLLLLLDLGSAFSNQLIDGWH